MPGDYREQKHGLEEHRVWRSMQAFPQPFSPAQCRVSEGIKSSSQLQQLFWLLGHLSQDIDGSWHTLDPWKMLGTKTAVWMSIEVREASRISGQADWWRLSTYESSLWRLGGVGVSSNAQISTQRFEKNNNREIRSSQKNKISIYKPTLTKCKSPVISPTEIQNSSQRAKNLTKE